MTEYNEQATHAGQQEILEQLGRLQTINLDLVERLGLVEMGAKFSDQHRQSLINTVTEVGQKLEGLRDLPIIVSGVVKDIRDLEVLVTAHEKQLLRNEGRDKTLGLMLSLAFAAIGALMMLVIQWLVRKVGG